MPKIRCVSQCRGRLKDFQKILTPGKSISITPDRRACSGPFTSTLPAEKATSSMRNNAENSPERLLSHLRNFQRAADKRPLNVIVCQGHRTRPINFYFRSTAAAYKEERERAALQEGGPWVKLISAGAQSMEMSHGTPRVSCWLSGINTSQKSHQSPASLTDIVYSGHVLSN